MSSHSVKKLEYRLNPGITLRVSQSNVVVQFNFEEHYFKEYIKAKTNNLPENYLENETVDPIRSRPSDAAVAAALAYLTP